MLTKLGLKFYVKTDNKEDCSNCTYIISQYILSILRNLVSKLTKEDLRYNAVAFFRLTSQKQKETAGMPEYARKGKAALSKESFFFKTLVVYDVECGMGMEPMQRKCSSS